jgi:predicted DNA-binding protein (MmcQ/YjbR family)
MDARYRRPVFARLRRACLSLPETVEAVAWGHPNFKAGGRTFCALEIIKGRPSVALRASPADIRRVKPKEGYFSTPYGRNVWVSRWLDGRVNWREIEALIRNSYRAATKRRG